MRPAKQLGEMIQRLRKGAGISQEEFAEKINISRTHMGHIEQGRRKPSLRILEKIAKGLRVQVKDLIPF
jgi:transcriptional regulator with XRE-family HTH domain